MHQRPIQMRKRRVFFTWIVLGAASLVAGSSAFALTVRQSASERLEESDYVVRGRVVSQRSADVVVKGLPFIYTDVEVKVLETLKAPSDDPNPSTLTVRIPGGEQHGMSMTVSDAPDFQEGEQVILLLDRLRDRHCRLVGGSFGKYLLVSSQTTGLVRNAAGGPLEPAEMTDLGLDPAQADSISPATFLSQLRDLLDE